MSKDPLPPELFTDIEKGRQAIEEGIVRLTDLFASHLRDILGPIIEAALRQPLSDEEKAAAAQNLAAVAIFSEVVDNASSAEELVDTLDEELRALLEDGTPPDPALAQKLRDRENDIRQEIDAVPSDEEIATEVAEEVRMHARYLVIAWFNHLRECADYEALDTRTLDAAMLPTAAMPEVVEEFLGTLAPEVPAAALRAVFEKVRQQLPAGQALPDDIVIALELHDVVVTP